ncbi:MAG: nucleotidyltransferase domain-containing protein, partial [Nanoarchaeota archaeon]|nr:nucleotidyltransferase domain-containing protein [Nanoarchaeota archaeon]
MVDISFEYKKRSVEYHYDEKDLELARKFSNELRKELGDLLKGTVLFGSAARGGKKEGSDVDILIILNDLQIVLSKDVVSGLRVLIENVAARISNQFHLTTMHLSEFWDYARQGDPIIVNILREGMPVYDEGFFLPMQTLLDEGKIRPTKEAVWAYYLRAPKTIKSAQTHLLSAIVDCYWA